MTTADDFTPGDIPQRPAGSTETDPRRYVTNADGTTRDRVLDRPVVARVSAAANADDLQAEARFLGRLTHAGLPCVLDFVRSDDGAVLVTQPINGRSLAAAVAARASGNDVSQLADATTCTLFFIQICDALTAAHLRGVVHGALVPEAIMLGDDGQIVIDGWTQAMKAMQRPSTMRVSAHAPVPTVLSADGLHDDIRALGTCFYTALAGEAPARTADGRLSEVSLSAQRHIPSALEAIIRKAMTSTAGEGYHSVADVRADLTRFLTGQTPLAVGPSGLAVMVHTISTHARALVVVALSIAVLIGAVVAYNWRAVKTYATWGAPLIDERFDSDSWKSQWKSLGTWERQDGRLVSKSEYECALIFHERLNPPVAIEYNGTFSSSVRPGDLSVWWCEGDAFSVQPGIGNVDDLNGWWMQAGAISNSWCTVWQTPSRVRSQVNNLVLTPDVDHRFRVEIETDSLKMWVDGILVLEHHELFPIGSGTVGLYTWDPGKSFDNVRIWQKEVPELISPLAIGDEAYRAGKFAEAAVAYSRVAASHRGKPLGDQAVYFQGLAQHKQGNPVMARKTWQNLPDGILHHRADCLALDEYIDEGDVPAAADRFATLWRDHPDIRDLLIQRWQICGQRLRKKRPILSAEMDKWMAVREAAFPNDTTSRWLVAEMLNLQQRWEEVIKRFPDEHRAVVPAMLALGQNKEVLAASWSTSYERISALMGMGDLEGALRSPDLHKGVRAEILCKMGRFDESAQISLLPAAIYREQIDDLLANNSLGAWANNALIAAGRLEEAAGAGVAGSPSSGRDNRALILLGRLDEVDQTADTRFYRVLAMLQAGQIEEARAMRSDLTGKRSTGSCWFNHSSGLSLIDVALGDTNALRKSIEHGASVSGAWGGRMGLICQAALDPAKDAAVSAMPHRTEAAAWLCVAQALRGELAQDTKAALAAWKAFTALPMRQRLVDGHNPCIELEAIAAWRIAALSK